MKLFFDFFPIIAFFIAYKAYDIYAATIVAIVAVVLQITYGFIRGHKPELMHIVTLVLVCLLGGATLWLHDEMFIKWKPTAVYWILALILLVSHFIGSKPVVQHLLDKNIQMPNKAWRALNLGWFGFFTAMGCLNLFVVYNFDTNTWVNFKLFGTLALTFAFVIAQGFYLAPYLQDKQGEK